MIDVIPLAFLSALYPTLLAVVVVVLQRPDPRRLLGAYLAGAVLTSMVVAYVIVTALREGNVVGRGDVTVGPGVNLFLGAIALLLVWFLVSDWGRERRERMKSRREAKQAKRERPPWSERVIQRGSVRLTFLVGMVFNLPGAMYLVALKDVAAANIGIAETVGVLLLYNLIMFQWAEIPLVGYAVAPERTQVLITSMNGWLRAHAREVAIVICSIAAAFLITRGITGAHIERARVSRGLRSLCLFSGLDNPIHLLVIAVVVIILFGPSRFPQIGRAVGSGIRELKGSLGGDDDSADKRDEP